MNAEPVFQNDDNETKAPLSVNYTDAIFTMSMYSYKVFFSQKKTVDRLLKKQDSKVAKISRLRSSKKVIPMFSYINNRDMVGLSVPASYNFPMEVQCERYGHCRL